MKIKIPFRDRNQMTMKEKIANPLSIDEAVEFSDEIRKCIIPITDYCLNDTDSSSFNKT